MTVIEPCVDTVVASHKLPTSRPASPGAKQARLTHGSMPFEPDPGGCSNRLYPCRLPRLQAQGRVSRQITGGADKGDGGTTMTDIRYLSPRTLDEAISAFAAAGSAARILAGGTDLLVQMRSGAVRPGLIVDIKKIAEMTAIEETADGGFRIGAAVSGAVLAEHPRFGKVWPGVLEAVNLIGSTQVQGRASAGGNLCNGSPAGDSVPAMVAAGAIVTVQGPNGRREMPVEKVPAGPGRTNLLPGEILVSFTLPPRPPGSSDAYLRMIPRTEMDIAVVGVGVSLTLKRWRLHRRPGRARRGGADRAAGRGGGESADRQPTRRRGARKPAAACSAACRPIDDKRGTIAYRTKVAGVLLKRTVAIAAQRAPEGIEDHGQTARFHHHQRRAGGVSLRAQ